MAKGCYEECLDTALSCGILAIYHQPLRYLGIKLGTNIIKPVKIHVVMPILYGLIGHGFQPISIQGSSHPVYKLSWHLQDVGLSKIKQHPK
jgi:hypothetical protein